MSYFLRYFLPGFGMILLAFWAGSQENFIFSFIGFLSFFTIGVALIIEGRKQNGNSEKK